MSHIFFVGQQQWGTKQDVSLLDNSIWYVYIPLSVKKQRWQWLNQRTKVPSYTHTYNNSGMPQCFFFFFGRDKTVICDSHEWG